MRLLFFCSVSFLVMNCCYPQSSSSKISADTILRGNIFSDSAISVNYRKLSELSRYASRYTILSSVNSSYRSIWIDYTVQDFLKTEKYSDSSLMDCLNIVNEKMTLGESLYAKLVTFEDITGKELFYGVWRNQITRSTSDDEIRQSIINGTNTLIDLGYSDMGNDFFPFITVLMEEQHLYNYDQTRTKGVGKGSRGIVSSVDILNALGSQDPNNKFGVCRDIHETARQLLKPMCEVYFEHFYPEKKIDFDDYLFLQSWTTDASQHVTLSLINPLNTEEVYELDWGRVIKKTNITGYNNGRLYGNTYRIWQYNEEKQMSGPVDFKRTQFGKILDEDILTAEEYRQFNGIYDEEFYSNIRYLTGLGKSGKLNFSIGGYYPDQKYFLASYYLHTKKVKVTPLLNHSNTIAMQVAIHEDTRKKELLYPQTDWQSAISLMGVPRIISKFESNKFKINNNITFNAFLNQQLDVFLIMNSFYMNDSINDKDFTHSGDGNISFSNGLNFDYYSDNKSISSSFTIQGRSCLLPKDVRLMSPNPIVLLSNMRFITPAIDAVSNTVIKLNENSNLSINALLEFTNMKAILFSGSIAAKIGVSKNIYFVTSIGGNDQLKGMEYFWYPVSRNWIDLQFNYFNNALFFSLQKSADSPVTTNISFRRYLTKSGR